MTCARQDVKRALEHLQAGDVQRSAKGMAEIAQPLEKYRRVGARPMDGRPQEVAVTSMESTLGNVRFGRHHRSSFLVALATVICLSALCYDATMF